MAGAGLIIETRVLENKVPEICRDIVHRMAEDPEPALHIIGAITQASIQRNFEKEGRPDRWVPLADATLKTKPNSKILQVKGYGGGLLGSINYQVNPTAKMVSTGTNKIYGAIHNFGGQAGPGHKVTIPARPFLLLQDEDMREIRVELAEYYLEGKA